MKIRNITFLSVFMISLLSCNCQNTSNRRNIVDNHTIDSATSEDTEYETTEDRTRETLNDIRFDGWTKKEWADNEYIREVRIYQRGKKIHRRIQQGRN